MTIRVRKIQSSQRSQGQPSESVDVNHGGVHGYANTQQTIRKVGRYYEKDESQNFC